MSTPRKPRPIPRPRFKLTRADIETASTPGELRDSGVPGLLVRVRRADSKSFVVVSEKRNARWSKTIGRWPTMSLDTARDLAKTMLGDAIKRDAFPERYVGTETLRTFAKRYFERVNMRGEVQSRRMLEAGWVDLLDKPLRDITRNDIEHQRSKWIRAGAAPATANRKCSLLRGLFSRAVEWGDLIVHPMRGVKALRVVDDERARTLTDAERGRLYGVIDAGSVDPAMGTAIYLLLNSGARMGELRGLRAQDIDTVTKTLTIRATTSKTAKARRIPINRILAERLKTHPAWVTPERRAWVAAMRAAQIENFTPHHCRHDFLSRMASAGVPMHIVSKLAGHSSIVLTAKYYMHMSDQEAVAAVEKH